MPRGPRTDEPASKRMVILITPKEHAQFFALARRLRTPLSALVRALLAKEDRAQRQLARALPRSVKSRKK